MAHPPSEAAYSFDECNAIYKVLKTHIRKLPDDEYGYIKRKEANDAKKLLDMLTYKCGYNETQPLGRTHNYLRWELNERYKDIESYEEVHG